MRDSLAALAATALVHSLAAAQEPEPKNAVAQEPEAKTADAQDREAQTADTQEPEAESADKIARELANPNTPMATLNFKFQFRSYEGNLPDADDQFSSTLLFQPSMPFPLDNGDLFFFRPAIPIQIHQPVFDAGERGFDSRFGLGDITFDLAYGRTTPSGLVLAAGLVSTVPTATSSELGGGRLTVGPELLIAKLGKNYVLGVFPSHQWDVAGWTDKSVNVTNLQLFATLLPGGGWNVGSSPTFSYDWGSDQWTIPININVGQTVIRDGQPWKLSVEINYFVEKSDSFGMKWFVGVNIAPVVENALAKLFK